MIILIVMNSTNLEIAVNCDLRHDVIYRWYFLENSSSLTSIGEIDYNTTYITQYQTVNCYKLIKMERY